MWGVILRPAAWASTARPARPLWMDSACRAPRRPPTRATPRAASRTARMRATGCAARATFGRAARARRAPRPRALSGSTGQAAASAPTACASRAPTCRRTGSSPQRASRATLRAARSDARLDTSRRGRPASRAMCCLAVWEAIGRRVRQLQTGNAYHVPQPLKTPFTPQEASHTVPMPVIGRASPDIFSRAKHALCAARRPAW